jgi:hypothetical protein
MKRLLIIVVSFGYVLFGIGLNSGDATSHRRSTITRMREAPSVRIEGVSSLAENQALAFQCKISNSGSEPLYIYSSLLEKPQFAEIVIDPKENVIEVRFSRLETSPLLPYYFPRATFLEIRRNSSADFHVALNGAVKDLRSYKTVNERGIEERITPARWMLRIMIGYGDDLSAVKRALALDPKGTQHPINEIVKWQKVAYSNSISVEVTK